jgi:hypothetical protein
VLEAEDRSFEVDALFADDGAGDEVREEEVVRT